VVISKGKTVPIKLNQCHSPLWAVYLDAYRRAGGKIDEASLRKGYYWARVATGLQYLPWIAANRPIAPAMISQVLEAEKTLRKLYMA
jgi:hypothetical protein